MGPTAPLTTLLFTDIQGSTRLWEAQPDRMRAALARHDAVARALIADHGGRLLKMTGDGVFAVFDDPLSAVSAVVELQLALAQIASTHAIELCARSGLHVGAVEARDDDVSGTEVNRAARIMNAAHGGQIVLSHAAALLVRDRLPAGQTLLDLGSVRLNDLSMPERVYQLRHPLLRDTFPALRVLETTPHNLPQQLTSFVGRGTLIEQTKSLLRSHRLVTLIGAGGFGKSRLALQAAAALLDRYPQGVWFVDLAPVSDRRLVPQVVASALGIKEARGRPVVEALLREVGDRILLVLLDNCEHLLEACAEIAHQLLQAGPWIRILASSREPLRIAGEVTLPVPSLSIPSSSDCTMVTAASQFDSVRLFLDRAKAARPGFDITPGNAATVADICRRLDGIPLAIELAASRVRSMPLALISVRLGDRFRLLTGGSRDARPQQQTLRALIDWSYELLDDREQALFCSLAVFAGGWTIEAAEAVASDEGVDGNDVVDILTRLVEKSLVVLDADGERYRFLDTIAEYALQRLEESGATTVARKRHRDYFVSYAERVFPELFGGEQVRWMACLDRELDNVLAAHAWCASEPDAGPLDLRLVHAIKPYYYNRGLLDLALRITTEALEHPGAAERNSLRCRGLFTAGQLCFYMGQNAAAQAYLEESLAIARETDDRHRVATVLQPLGMAVLGQGDATAAHCYLSEAVAVAREIGTPRDVAGALNALAQYHRLIDELETADALYRQVMAICDEQRDRESMCIALLNLAMVAIIRGTAVEARRILSETLTLLDELGSHQIGQSLIEVSSGLAALQGEWARCARQFGVSEAHARRTGIHRDAADDAFLAPRIRLAREALGAAAFAAAEGAGRSVAYDEGIEEVRQWLDSPDPVASTR